MVFLGKNFNNCNKNIERKNLTRKNLEQSGGLPPSEFSTQVLLIEVLFVPIQNMRTKIIKNQAFLGKGAKRTLREVSGFQCVSPAYAVLYQMLREGRYLSLFFENPAFNRVLRINKLDIINIKLIAFKTLSFCVILK
ncbi:hypothetical protein FD724_01225 [Nostoc sp. C057]|uniref:hypothetical protein n=1 Tax=Nostoc sp. C057 TaxID=2576903 RepID=UPI0015C3B2A3|nr:hypothetical protein [Nostoc sp. C057]QLE46904.1 hypothetical protein FD724_01225 [Nostoc sp. C057]